MCCGRKDGQARERWVVTLANGLKVTKSSEVQARKYADKHPGATFKKLGE